MNDSFPYNINFSFCETCGRNRNVKGRSNHLLMEATILENIRSLQERLFLKEIV